MAKTFKDAKHTKLERSKSERPKLKMEPYKRTTKTKDY